MGSLDRSYNIVRPDIVRAEGNIVPASDGLRFAP